MTQTTHVKVLEHVTEVGEFVAVLVERQTAAQQVAGEGAGSLCDGRERQH